MRKGWIILTVGLLLAPIMAPIMAPAQSREQTLADIRQELSVLYVEVQRLKRELSTTGAAGGVSGGSALQRIDAIETELQRLTGKTEQLEYRINRVVTDGTNRIGDLEFRLVELEGGDVSTLGETTTLGGDTGAASSPVAAPVPASGGAEMALGEQADFDAALATLKAGKYRAAAEEFATYLEIYPGGPLSADAHFQRGEALRALGDTAPAARAYLASFSAAPQGERAPYALTQLGVALGDLGQTQEACVTLGEVGVRFPTSPALSDAQAAQRALACN